MFWTEDVGVPYIHSYIFPFIFGKLYTCASYVCSERTSKEYYWNGRPVLIRSFLLIFTTIFRLVPLPSQARYNLTSVNNTRSQIILESALMWTLQLQCKVHNKSFCIKYIPVKLRLPSYFTGLGTYRSWISIMIKGSRQYFSIKFYTSNFVVFT